MNVDWAHISLKELAALVSGVLREGGIDAILVTALVAADTGETLPRISADKLYFGAARHRLREDIRREIDDFTARISIIPALQVYLGFL